MKLCLDSLTLTDTQPAELIRAAGEAGFELVSLWVQSPALYPRALVTPENARACVVALEDAGVRVGPLEAFDLASSERVESYRPALELGARLGARTASAINMSNADAVRAGDLLARFAEVAGEFSLKVMIEPLAGYATSTLAASRRMVLDTGIDAGIVFDIYHLVREGGVAADLIAIPPNLIWHVQLCDGAASVALEEASRESWQERLYPGDGVFPLVEVLRLLPTDISWAVEAPSRRRALAGVSARAQACEAMLAMRRTLDRVAAG